jgi:hypothetical protein
MSVSRDHRLTAAVVQINNSFADQNYLPLCAGLLQTTVEHHAAQPERYRFLAPIYSRLPVQPAVEHLLPADVVGFSTYVWNIGLSLRIAEQLKQRRPETLIVFGGPQVPDRAEHFLRRYPFIDLVCHGEGERTWLDLLERCPERSWDGIGGLSYLRPDGTFVDQPRTARLRDLDWIPSPYLEGTFAELIAAHPTEQWIALWETNRGCPFSCAFCDWGSATVTKVFTFDAERLHREVDWFADQRIQFVYCCDANFGILQRDLELVNYVAHVKQSRGFPHALSVQNTKNATERAYAVQKALNDAGLNKGVTISLQSMDTGVLTAIKRRNISLETYQELQRRFTRDGVITYTDMILALPEETYESFVGGVDEIIRNGQHHRIQFNNLTILPNAEMGDPEYQRRFGMVVVESTIINLHGTLCESDDDVAEIQELVVGTHTMPPAEWVRTRVFCWITALLHFDKLFQLPLIVAHELGGLGYRELIELFTESDLGEFPVLAEMRAFFVEKARDMQHGGPEYCHSPEWLNIWWPMDEYFLIRLIKHDQVDAFCREAETLVARALEARGRTLPPGLLHEAVELSETLLHRPFQTEDARFPASYNLWEFYRAVVWGLPRSLEASPRTYRIDRTTRAYHNWDDWYREVIWWGNKKGAYQHDNVSVVG